MKLLGLDPKFRVLGGNGCFTYRKQACRSRPEISGPYQICLLKISKERWLGGWVDRTYFGSIINIPVGDAPYNGTKGAPKISAPRKICLLWDTHVMQTNVTNWLDKKF